MDIQQYFRLFLFLACLSLFGTASSKVHAQTDNIKVSLSQDWLVYDWDAELYLPYIPKIHDSYNSLSLFLNTQDYTKARIQIQHSEPLDIFINNKLFYSLEAKKTLNISISELTSKSNDSLLSLSVHTTKVFKESPNLIVTNKDFIELESYHFSKEDNIVARDKNLFENKLLLLIIIFIVGFTISNRSPLNPLVSLNSIEGIRSFLLDYKHSANFKFNLVYFGTYLFLISCIISASVLLLNVKLNIFGFEITNFIGLQDSLSPLDGFLSIFLFALTLIILKLSIIWFVGILFNLKNETLIHFHEFIIISQIFFLVLFLILVISGFYPYLFDNQFLEWLLKYGFLLIATILSLKIYRVISFKNVFIISYFCITEFVPALIMVRFF